MNTFEFIFAVLFLMKITKTGIVSDWSWFWIILPMLINLINFLFRWVIKSLNLETEWRQALADDYIRRKKRKFAKQSLKEEKQKWSNSQN